MSPLFTLKERAQMAVYEEEVAKKEAYEEEVIDLEAEARVYLSDLLELTAEEIEEVEFSTVEYRNLGGNDPKPRVTFTVDGIDFSVRHEVKNQETVPVLEVAKRNKNGYATTSFTRMDSLAQLGRWMKSNGIE
jgi:hypothetical protein